jgi:hypothetical protein
MPMRTITSTVSVGNGGVAASASSSPPRRRSSTINVPGSRLLRKKDKSGDKDKEKAKGKAKAKKDNEEEKVRVIERVRERERERQMKREKANENWKGKEREKDDDKTTITGSTPAQVVSDPIVSSAANPSADPNFESPRLNQSVKGTVSEPFHRSPSRFTIRHVRSQSSLPRANPRDDGAVTASSSHSLSATRSPQDTAGASQDVDAGTGGSSSKKRMKIVKGVSVRAERFVRGLDSALDFVDGRVGFGAV